MSSERHCGSDGKPSMRREERFPSPRPFRSPARFCASGAAAASLGDRCSACSDRRAMPQHGTRQHRRPYPTEVVETPVSNTTMWAWEFTETECRQHYGMRSPPPFLAAGLGSSWRQSNQRLATTGHAMHQKRHTSSGSNRSKTRYHQHPGHQSGIGRVTRNDLHHIGRS